MNPVLVTAFLRQRLASPLRMFILVATFLFPFVVAMFIPAAALQLLSSQLTFSLILGAGMIGQDVSSGVLQLLFARPVRRSEYVLSRWITTGAAGVVLTIVQLALVLLIVHNRAPVDGAVFLKLAGERASVEIGIAATLALLSSVVAGFGDVALYVVASVLFGVCTMLGGAVQKLSLLGKIGQEANHFLNPSLDTTILAAGGVPAALDVVQYLLAVTACLALAIVVVSKKELSYAS